MLQNRKITSTAIISLLIISMFFSSAPLALAGVPCISVSPSIAKPGQTVCVYGYKFLPSKTVDIYIDHQDPEHKLGSVTTSSSGSFFFLFTMQSSYPGTHTIIAVDPPGPICTATFTLKYTNPLDERLVDLLWDLEVKLDGIIADIGTWPTAHFTDIATFADWLYGELITDITTAGTAWGWTDLASALASIKTEIVTIDSVVDGIATEIGDIAATYGRGKTNVAGALDDIKDEIEGIQKDLEDKPVIKEATFFEDEAPFWDGSGTYQIVISSNRHFQVKAVYLEVKDPNGNVDLVFYPTDLDPPYTSHGVLMAEFGRSFQIPCTGWNPSPREMLRSELLSQLCIKTYPAASGGDAILIFFDVSSVEDDETVYVKVLVETAQVATAWVFVG